MKRITMTYEKEGFMDTMTRIIVLLPLNLALKTLGVIAAITIIGIPASVLLFKMGNIIWYKTYKFECPSCGKKISIQGGSEATDCMYCKERIVATWRKPA
ncbi:DUF2614 family zinc ribbon-containing protein [Halalkalibacterium halodurans]|uniref:DUF2614 family zinc ribbon-containing protein n=1 Tax=Halalkalibacterium halodurans TaxID=86665 RepID=UPI002E1DBCBF|nr:DUF2614 family zinc ribbon-containing protein [Halalkalibacterium halodurans]